MYCHGNGTGQFGDVSLFVQKSIKIINPIWYNPGLLEKCQGLLHLAQTVQRLKESKKSILVKYSSNKLTLKSAFSADFLYLMPLNYPRNSPVVGTYQSNIAYACFLGVPLHRCR